MMANDIAKATITGNLVRDAELSFLNTGDAKCVFTVASNKSRKSGDGWSDYANFFSCTLWGKRAESLTQYLVKGTFVVVDADIHHNRWEKDGEKRERIEFQVKEVRFFSRDNGGGGRVQSAPAKNADVFEDDVPF